jgi:hypothetical protein
MPLPAILIIAIVLAGFSSWQWKKNYEKGLVNVGARDEAEFFRYCTIICLAGVSVSVARCFQTYINTIIYSVLGMFGSAVVCTLLSMAVKSSLKVDLSFLKNKAFSSRNLLTLLLSILSAVLLVTTIYLTIAHFVPIKDAFLKFFKPA